MNSFCILFQVFFSTVKMLISKLPLQIFIFLCILFSRSDYQFEIILHLLTRRWLSHPLGWPV